MVFAFIVQTISSSPCRIIFYNFYGHDKGFEADKHDVSRSTRKELFHLVAVRVQSEYMFKQATSFLNVQQDLAAQSSTPISSMESGIFRLTKGDPFDGEYHVIWKGMGMIGVTLVLHPEENKILAEGVLKLLVKYIFQIFRPFERPEELLQRPEYITSLLHVFLPSGQLIFMNHRVVKQYEKELNRILADKK